MKEVDVLKDLLQYKISSQTIYNENIIDIMNPEARELFTELRDGEMRGITELQQKIARMESSQGIISRIFTSKSRY